MRSTIPTGSFGPKFIKEEESLQVISGYIVKEINCFNIKETKGN